MSEITLEQMADPRFSLPRYAKIKAKAGAGLIPYNPTMLTSTLQRDILDYWANPPRDPRTGDTLWRIFLASRQTGKSTTVGAAAYVKTAYSTVWRHLCTADTPDRADMLIGRVNDIHESWPLRLRMRRRWAQETKKATFVAGRLAGREFGERTMFTQHAAMNAIGDAIDSQHWSECDFVDGAAYWSALRPALTTNRDAIVCWETTANPGNVVPATGWFKSQYLAAKRGTDLETGAYSRFRAGFYPFWDGLLNRAPWPKEWTPDLEELRLLDRYGPLGLTLDNLAFRRQAIHEDQLLERNPGLFGIWYPFDDVSCWPAAGNSTFDTAIIARQKGSGLLQQWPEGATEREYPGRRRPAGEPDPDASYIIAVDPNGFGGRDHGVATLRECWDDLQLQRAVIAGGARDGVQPDTIAAWVVAQARKFGARVFVEANGVGQAVIALIKQHSDVSIYHRSKGKPGIAASTGSKAQALAAHRTFLRRELFFQSEWTLDQHADYQNDKAVEESDGQLQLNAGPTRRRRDRSHWDQVSAEMWASWAVRHAGVRLPSLPEAPEPKVFEGTAEDWDAWQAAWGAEQRRDKGNRGLGPYTIQPGAAR